MKLFHYDNPVMQALAKVADIMMLNMVALICCIPIFTVGASMTALHYVSLKVVRGEDVYLMRDFFKSFKQNFKQATVIWLIFFVILALLIFDLVLMFTPGAQFPAFIKVVIMAVCIFVLLAVTCVFPLQAKFDNPVGRTIKNAFLMCILQLPKVVLMVACYALPAVISILFYQIVPIMFFICLAGPTLLAALLYNKFFKKLENGVLEAQQQAMEESGIVPEQTEPEEDERIFKDELDEALIAANEQKYQ